MRYLEIDAAYCAGLIDGEGTIGLTRRDGPFISVASNEWALVYIFKKMFSGHIVKKKARLEGHKDGFVWKAVGDRALSVLEIVRPYLHEPYKQKKASLLIERYKGVTQHNGKYTPEQRADKLAFEKEFQAIGCSRVC